MSAPPNQVPTLTSHAPGASLLRSLDLPRPCRLLDLGLDGVPAWIFLPHPLDGAHPADAVMFVSSDMRETAAAQALAARGDSAVDVRLTEGLEPEAGEFDLVVYGPHPRETKLRVFEWMDVAFGRLKVGGQLVLLGRKDRGVESYRARAEEVFGGGVEGPKAGRERLFGFEKTGRVPGAPPVDPECAFEVTDLPGGPSRFVTRAGVFSRDGFDPGSRFLVETVPLAGVSRVLDVGCGWGAIGVNLARRLPEAAVTMVDVDIRAVRCAGDNAVKNGLRNATATLSDVYGVCREETFDLIVSNPPFHAGNAVGHPLILGAPARLAPGGRLVLVVARPGPYLKALRRAFPDVRALAERGGYTVLCGSRGP